jgi:hypothetical protein
MRRNAQAGMLPYQGLDIREAENLIPKARRVVIGGVGSQQCNGLVRTVAGLVCGS